jgi:hypothetical protein
MAFSCKYCGFKVFWDTTQKANNGGKAILRNIRDPEQSVLVCSVQRMLYKQQKEEEEAIANFIASVRLSTAEAILNGKYRKNKKEKSDN